MEFVIAFVASFAGAFLAATITRRVRIRLPLPFVPASGHVHEFDTMRADGVMRCGICDAPKKRGT